MMVKSWLPAARVVVLVEAGARVARIWGFWWNVTADC